MEKKKNRGITTLMDKRRGLKVSSKAADGNREVSGKHI